MNRDSYSFKLSRGFSLIELLFTLTISAVLLSLALPSYSYLINDIDVDHSAKGLFTMLSLARSSAVEKRKQVTLCGIESDQLACVPFKWSGESDWSNGVLVFIDHDKNERFSSDVDTVLKVSRFRLSSMTVKSSTGSFIAYKSSGYAQGFSNGTVTFISNDYVRQLKVTNLGRVRYIPQGQ